MSGQHDPVVVALAHLEMARDALMRGDEDLARGFCGHAHRVWREAGAQRADVARALRGDLEDWLRREVLLARWLHLWPEQLAYLRDDVQQLEGGDA